MKKKLVASFFAVLFCFSLSVGAYAEPVAAKLDESVITPRLVMNLEGRGYFTKKVNIRGTNYNIYMMAESKGTYHDSTFGFISNEMWPHVTGYPPEMPGTAMITNFGPNNTSGSTATRTFTLKISLDDGGTLSYNFIASITAPYKTIDIRQR